MIMADLILDTFQFFLLVTRRNSRGAALIFRRAVARIVPALIVLALASLLFPNLSQSKEAALRPGFDAWTGDYGGMEKRRLIRILVPYSKTIYFIDRGEQLGTAVEFGQALERQINKNKKKEVEKIRVAFVPVARDRLLPALIEGRGDIVAANLTITPSRQQIVDFTDPLASGVKEILVTGPAAPKIAAIDDLGGKEIRVRASSSYFEHLQKLNSDRRAAGQAEIGIAPIDENLEDEDLLEMVNAGLLPWCVVDGHKARIWSRVFDNIELHDDIAIAQDGEIAWAVRKNSPELMKRLNAFVKQYKVGTTFGNILKKRYYQDDKMVRSAYEQSEVDKFQALRDAFEKYSAAYKLNALLLAAQGYQESRLDQSERSSRGAVGIMQMLPSTAADKAIGISGIAESSDRNIEAGAKYMRYLSATYVNDAELDPVNRALLTLAAYNAGPGNLRKFRSAAKTMGLNPDLWFGNVENGAAKVVGRETVQYVGNIYKYFVAYTLLEEQKARRGVNKAQSE